MKKSTLALMFLLSISLNLVAQTEGQLDVSVTTSHAGGNYKPKNIVAIWIEDNTGAFVKTLLAYADKRKTHLNNWQASTKAAGSEYNKTDAVTGATVSSHGNRTCTWDGNDFNGNPMPDGEYNLLMELTDKNNTGNYSSFDISKSSNLFESTPSDKPSFSSIEITWNPNTSNIVFNDKHSDLILYPNPVKKYLNLSSQPKETVYVVDLKGQIHFIGRQKVIDVQNLTPGIYFILDKNGKKQSFIKGE